ncbi:class I SAM-dependent methyltransferase [bacterium]|nr:class I SAM-dependent methyltransferase [bacterium]
MPRIQAFEDYTEDYETWFDRHPFVYQSELQAIRKMMPEYGAGIEIGAGSGRFAGPLNITYGVEPSPKMCQLAKQYRINMIRGIAESLPIRESRFDFALMVTAICFVDSAVEAFREIHRILRPKSPLILGFVDKRSPLGRRYERNRTQSRFYREATFYSVDEALHLLSDSGFHSHEILQTLFKSLDRINHVEPVLPGYGQGSFVVIKSIKTHQQENQ